MGSPAWLKDGAAERTRTAAVAKQRGAGEKAPDLKIDNAEYAVLLIGPPPYHPSRPDIESFMHYKVGDEEKMCTCIAVDNSIVFHPAVQTALEKRKTVVKPSDGCPVCEVFGKTRPTWLLGEPHGNVEKMESKRPVSWWGVVPWFKWNGKSNQWDELDKTERVPSFFWTDDRVSVPLWALLEKEGDHVFDYDAATLVTLRHRLEKTAGGAKRHHNEVGLHSDTIRSPLAVPAKLREKIEEARKVGGSLDLHTKIAYLTRPRTVLEAMLNGDGATTSEGGSDSRPRTCYGLDSEIDGSDATCRACVYKYGCARAAKTTAPAAPSGLAVTPASGYEPDASQKRPSTSAPERSLKRSEPTSAEVAERTASRRVPVPAKEEPEPEDDIPADFGGSPDPEIDADGDPVDEDGNPVDDEPEPQPKPAPVRQTRRARTSEPKPAASEESAETEKTASDDGDVDEFEKILRDRRAATSAGSRTVTRRA